MTKQDSNPLPRIDDLLDQLGESHFFSTLDLASGYWKIRIHEDSIPKTAFVTTHGPYQCFLGFLAPHATSGDGA